MTAPTWVGVKVKVQSALAAAETITAITKANPGVVSCSSPPADGSYVLLKVDGMTQVNNRVFRTANAGAGDFELEGEDTSLYDTFVDGTFEVVTLDTNLKTLVDFQASGGETNYLDDTTIHDLQEIERPGLASPFRITSTSKFDPSDPALKALEAAHAVQAERVVMVEFRDGKRFLINGFISFPFTPGGNAREIATTPLGIAAQGRPTVYAT